jgi:hypothetical protein
LKPEAQPQNPTKQIGAKAATHNSQPKLRWINHQPDQDPVAGQANLPKLSATTTNPNCNTTQGHYTPATPRENPIAAFGTCKAAHKGTQARKKSTVAQEENLEKPATPNHHGHHTQMMVKKENRERQPQHESFRGDTAAKMDEDLCKAKGKRLGQNLAAAPMKERTFSYIYFSIHIDLL